MKTFTYTAKDAETNKIVHSTVQADSEREAAKVLIAQDLSPLAITEQSKNNFLQNLTQRITNKDKVVFTRQLATLVEAGLPLAQSLRTIADQTQNKKMQVVVQEIVASVEGGKSLGDAFSRHPQVFDKVYLALVRAGEVSGTLDEALKRIANQQEKDEAIMRRVRGALYYPAIVLFVIVLVLIFMLVTIVPQIEELYAGLNKPLPLLTALLVWTASFIKHFWWAILIVSGIVFYFMGQYFKTDQGIRVADALKLNTPAIGKLFQKLYMARFTRTAETLLVSGVPMIDMLNITSDAVNNVHVAKGIDVAVERVKGGTALSKAIADQDYFPILVPQMIKIGEQSGRISQMLGKVANVYEDELDEQIKALSTIIEPALMVVMAIMAGGIVMSILFPIYSLVSTSGGSLGG